MRVTTQLISAADGAHVWSERFDRELRDIFAVQDEISGAITAALRVKLSGEREAAPQRYRPQLAAYEAYPKAKHHLARVTPDSFEVWPRMNLHAYLQGAGRDREAYAQAMKAAELDANLVVALVSIAHFHAYWASGPKRWQRGAARRRRGPWYPDAVATLAGILVKAGAQDEARELYQSLGQGESFGDVRAQALYYLLIGDLETAADWVERGLEERDHSLMYYLRFVIGRALKASGRWPKIARMARM